MKTVFIIFDVKIESQGFNRRGPSRPIKVMNSCCGNSKEVQSLTKKIFLSAYVITIHFTLLLQSIAVFYLEMSQTGRKIDKHVRQLFLRRDLRF